MALFDTIFAGDSGVAVLLLKTMGVTDSIFTHVVEGVYDPRTDNVNGEDIVSKTVTTSPVLKYTAEESKLLEIEKEDCKIIGSGVDFGSITVNRDTVQVNGETYMIVSYKPLYSGKQLAAVVMQCRKQVV